MARLNRWLGTLANMTAPRPAPLGVQHLDDRIVPNALGVDTSEHLVAISGDGTAALFTSNSNAVVAGVTDLNGTSDLFWRDLKTGATKLVTAAAGTTTAIGFGSSGSTATTGRPAVFSQDGRYVAYVSANNAAIVTGAAYADLNDTIDVFRWDAATGGSRLVSVRGDNATAVGDTSGIDALDPEISDDGRFVAFGTTLDAANLDGNAPKDAGDLTFDLFRHDFSTTVASTVAVTSVPGTGAVFGAGTGVARPVGRYMSGDGRIFVFSSAVEADTIGLAPDLAGTSDVFVRDLAGGLALASITTAGTAVGGIAGQAAVGAVLSRSGNAVLFASNARGGATTSSLVAGYQAGGASADLYVRKSPFSTEATTQLVTAATGSMTRGANGDIDVPAPGERAGYQISDDGRVIAFASSATTLTADTEKGAAGFIRDTTKNSTDRATIGYGTIDINSLSLSDDGRYAGFVTGSGDSAKTYVRDRTLATTITVEGTNGSAVGIVANTGDVVAFTDAAVSVVIETPVPPTVPPTTVPPAVPPTTVPPTTVPPVSTATGSQTLVVSGQRSGDAQNYTFDATGNLVASGADFTPFPDQASRLVAVRGLTADFNGDGVTDTAYATGAGASLIRIVDGKTGTDLVASTSVAFGARFFGGEFLAAGDLDGDGKAELIVTPDVGGGPRVRVFDVSGGTLVGKADFFGIDDVNFRGGARATLGDVNGDGVIDLVVAAGQGGGPRIAVFDGKQVMGATAAPPKLVPDFFALPGLDAQNLRNGVFVSAGDLNGDGFADLVFGAGNGGGPQVYAIDGKLATTDVAEAQAKPLASFFAFDNRLRGGVRITVKDIDRDGKADIIAGIGEGSYTQLKSYSGASIGTTPDNPVATTIVDPFPATHFGSKLATGVFVG